MRNLEDYQKELAHVKELLRANPRGMTVTDISREININRNSVAKYLDVLLISGQVDMKRMGPAKAYFLSDRVPISAMLNFSSDCIMVFNNHLEMMQVNDVFLDLMRVERDDVIYRKLNDAHPYIFNDPDIATGLQSGLAGSDASTEKTFKVQGENLCFNLKFIPATFQDGSPGVTLIMENITERKKAEETLRETEERLENFMESATDGFQILDSELNYLEINKTALDQIGMERGDIIGKNILDIYPEFKESGRYDQYMRVLETGESLSIDDFVLHPTFGDRHFAVKVFKMSGGLGIISTDITERKMMEMALRESEERFSTICSNMTDIVFTMDLEKNFTLVSSSIEHILGYSVEETMSKGLKDLMTPSSHELIIRTLKEELEKEETGQEDPKRSRTLELELITKDGYTIIAEVKVTFLRDLDGRPVEILGLSRDITERLKYRDRLEALHAQALTLAQTSDIDELAKTTLDAIEMVFKVEDIEFMVVRDRVLELIERRGPGTPVRTVVPFDDQGIITKTARTMRSMLIHDVREDTDYFKARLKTLSELAVPVKIDDRVLAVINLESPKIGMFTLEDQKLLEIFAGHVASAMSRIVPP